VRVLHLLPYLFEPGGIPHQTRNLIAAQASIGVEVSTISLGGEFHEPFKLMNPPIDVRLAPSLLRGTHILQWFLKEKRPDIVHFTGTWIPIYQLWSLMVRNAGVPYVVTTHGNLSPHGMKVRFGGKQTNQYHILKKWIWQNYLDAPFLKAAAAVFAHSAYEEELLRSFGIKSTFIVPVGIDAEWLSKENCTLLRGLHKPITFLHLGRLDIFHKGLDLICEAIQLLVRESSHMKFKFILVGPTVNDSRNKLTQLASRIGHKFLEVRKEVSGQDKIRVWDETDYFLNIYRFAGMALAPCEALARGIPLIASREGNIGDWTTLWSMGFTVPLEKESLKDTFCRAIEISREQYHRFSSNAFRFAVENSWTKVADQTVQSYLRILNREDLTNFSAM
jgi:glycosyltransferase involved in cell wall biosynthesis